METDIRDCDIQIGRLDDEIKRGEGSQDEVRGKEAVAQIKYERLRGNQQSLLHSVRVPRT